MKSRVLSIPAFLVLTVGFACAQEPPSVIQLPPAKPKSTAPQTQPPAKPLPKIDESRKISSRTRMQIIRSLNAEVAFSRKPLPISAQPVVITSDGSVTPSDEELREQSLLYGAAARVGDQIRITRVDFKGKDIIFEINGGGKKKKKWYQRVEFMGPGGVATAPQNDPSVRGLNIAIRFHKHIPEITPAQVRAILSTIVDFESLSAAESYVAQLPPKVQEALQNHEVLVGMDKEMVTHAKGRPERRIREREGEVEYEEWIYGAPPADVEFVRFVGDEVVQLKIMKVDGEKIVKTEREVDLRKGESTVAQNEEKPPAPSAGKAPTLRRPGEAAPEPATNNPTPVIIPGQPQPGPTRTPLPDPPTPSSSPYPQ
jgi:hypothetical protein